MNEHLAAAIEAVTEKRMDQEGCGYAITSTGLKCGTHGEPFEVTAYADIYGYFMPTGYCPTARKEAEELITSALPHIRAMIAEETANSWIPHRDELAQAIASGYEPDHPVPNRHDYKATDSVLRLLTMQPKTRRGTGHD